MTVPADAEIDFADAGYGKGDGILWIEAVADTFSHPEHEEQSVVRPRSENDHDEQQLGYL